MKKLEFGYVKRSRNAMMIERLEIRNWRRDYLRQIRRYRAAGKRIYYLDETWITAGQTTSRKWVDLTIKTAAEALRRGLSYGFKAASSTGERVIIIHIGSDDGFVDRGLYTLHSSRGADYHDDMNHTFFEEWLLSILPELEHDSVIVLDNASYHSQKKDKIPNTSWNKPEIVNWLHGKGEAADLSLLKAELLTRARNLQVQTTYVVDEIIENSERHVLRTPPYHCTLNPIEMVWAIVKGYVSANNKTFKLADAKQLLLEGISRVTPVMWRNCVKHVVDIVEAEMWQLDDLIENQIDVEPFIINFGDSNSDDDE